ncbi:hypothetical protein AAVH_35192 [Aphelenchoides avenae]|nr:hypothetical protein AAVH_35192 [Aphelenchus avenae]
MPSTRLTYLQSISWECYLHHIIAFDKFDRFESVDLLVRKIEKVARTIKCTFSNEEECLRLAQMLYSAVAWMFTGILASFKLEEEQSTSSAEKLLGGIQAYLRNPFARLLVYTYTHTDPG